MPPVVYLVLAVVRPFPHPLAPESVATALAALLVCWRIGERQEGSGRVVERIAFFIVVAVGYQFACGLLLKTPYESRASFLKSSIPMAVVAGLLVQNRLSPNRALRHLVQPLVRWRAPWRIYLVALLAWPLLTLLVVWLSRVLPSSQPAPGLDRVVLTSAFRLSASSVLVLLPWALAWFGYGVPVLLHRASALIVGLLLGSLTWLEIAISELVRAHDQLATPVAYLNLGTQLAVSVVAVWLFQRSRGSIWPVLALIAVTASDLLLNWGGDGFGESGYGDWTALVVAQCALAAALVLGGRMWHRPRAVDGQAHPAPDGVPPEAEPA